MDCRAIVHKYENAKNTQEFEIAHIRRCKLELESSERIIESQNKKIEELTNEIVASNSKLMDASKVALEFGNMYDEAKAKSKRIEAMEKKIAEMQHALDVERDWAALK